jgi:hypothetical protein
MTELCRFDPANYLTDVETAVFYLQDAARDADPDALRQAVEDVARAMASVALVSTKDSRAPESPEGVGVGHSDNIGNRGKNGP